MELVHLREFHKYNVAMELAHPREFHSYEGTTGLALLSKVHNIIHGTASFEATTDVPLNHARTYHYPIHEVKLLRKCRLGAYIMSVFPKYLRICILAYGILAILAVCASKGCRFAGNR